MAVRWRRPRAPATPPPHPGPMDHSDHRAESFSTAPGQCFAVTTLRPRCPHVEIGSLARSWGHVSNVTRRRASSRT
jgi:hypothetical protein